MMRPHTKRIIRKFIAPFRKIGLNNFGFTIISNNCWGGYIYDLYGMKYMSPTIGIYFFAPEYIRFISNLEYYLSIDAEPLDIEKSRYKDEILKREVNPMIGHVGDVEFVFGHYKSVEDGILKWNKRRKRINFDNILVKFNDQNLFEPCFLESFKKCPYTKLFFTADKALAKYDFCVHFKEYSSKGYVVDDIKTSRKYVNFKRVLNSLAEVKHEIK